jgi:hypothetical protein
MIYNAFKVSCSNFLNKYLLLCSKIIVLECFCSYFDVALGDVILLIYYVTNSSLK